MRTRQTLSEDNPFLKSLPLTEEAVAAQVRALSKTPIIDDAEDCCITCDLHFVFAADARPLERERAELIEALRLLTDATADTLNVHPETECCTDTRAHVNLSRALLQRLGKE